MRKDIPLNPDLGEIILYQSEDGTSALGVHLKDETVWLSRQQMAELFGRDYKTDSKHINNVFNDGELRKKSVVANFATTGSDGKIYQVEYYNLDVVISVGYRVKSQRGTRFRIWATQVLKDHLVRGYTLNRQRLAEKGVAELKQAMALLATTLESHELVSDEGRAVLEVVSRYARTWRLLLEYDEERLLVPAARHGEGAGLGLDETRQAISSTSSSRIIPFPTATSGSAHSSSCSTCGGMALPVSTTGPWWPWPCSPLPASRGIRSCWCG